MRNATRTRATPSPTISTGSGPPRSFCAESECRTDDSRFSSKGSVALDGASLTVNEVDGATFGVNIIPHTLRRTTFGTLGAGDRVNFEVDTIARYVARLLGKD